MPDVVEALDLNRYAEIRHEALLAASLWISLAIAAERKDKVSAISACQNLSILTKKTFALVKQLGLREVEHG